MKKLLLLLVVLVGCSPATTAPMYCIPPHTADVIEVIPDTNVVDVREPRDYLVLKPQQQPC